MKAVDFRIEVGDPVPGGYRVTVRGEDDEFRGVAPLDFAADPALQTKLSYLRVVLQSSSAPSRAVASTEEQDVQFIGARLFRHLLVDESMGMLTRARRMARDTGRDLRITLRIRPPELAALPWEFMYDARPERNEYLARQCLVVRDAEDAAPTPPLRVTGPLRMLAMVADVADLPRLNTAAERERLENALSGLTESGRVHIEWIDATKASLVGALRQGPWHVFHYIGHGEYDAAAGTGRLAFAGPAGRPDLVSAGQLAATLGAHPTLRLAVLNACETGAGGADPHSSVAAAMIHGGLPAVVGMQYPITDLIAPVFSHAFYEALADGDAVDRCVQAGRMAIWLGNAASLEWGTPVLYQRSADGRVFEVGDPSQNLESSVPPARLSGAETRAEPSPVERPPVEDPYDNAHRRRLKVVTTDSPAVVMAFSPDESTLAVLQGSQQLRVSALRGDAPAWTADAPPRPFHTLPLTPTSLYFDPRGTRLHVIFHARQDLGPLVGATAFDFRWSTRTHAYINEERDVRAVVHDPADPRLPLVVRGRETCRVEHGTLTFDNGRRSTLGAVRHAALSRDHVAVVTGGGDIVVWRAATGETVKIIPAGGGPVALTADGTGILAGSRQDSVATLYSIDTGLPVALFPISGGWAYHPSGLFFSRLGKAGRLVRPDSAEPAVDIPWPHAAPDAADPGFSASGRYLAFPASESAVEIWDLDPASPPAVPGA